MVIRIVILIVILIIILIIIVVTVKHDLHMDSLQVPSHPFGVSMVGISITTENGHIDHADVPTAGGSSHTFNIPKNQGKG